MGLCPKRPLQRLRFDLKQGNNTLKVYSNLACQGVYEETIFLSEHPIVFPNPFENSTNIHVGSGVDRCQVQIFDAGGATGIQQVV